MHRLHSGDRQHASVCAPDQEFLGCPIIRHRVCGLRMLAAKNSRKRIELCSPAAVTSGGRAGEAIGMSWFTRQLRFRQIDEKPK
jgi:hypothetical protein